jgi:hypothetical protein
MQKPRSRLPRTAMALVGGGLLWLTLPFGTASAADLAPDQCAVAMMWVRSTRVPNGANPYSGYSFPLMIRVLGRWDASPWHPLHPRRGPAPASANRPYHQH